MIAKECLTLDWLERVSAQNNKADKILIEKVIRALLLLEGLTQSGLSFVFKGGTALMLLVDSTKRLSIDIDIILKKQSDIELTFNSFVVEKGFTRVELQHRDSGSQIEKTHYKFFYEPVHNTGLAQDYVLLDILFEEPHYINIVKQPISSSFCLKEGDPISVSVPSYEDILGDKLTAFAPNTTGIPYKKNGISRAMEIMKQLYDIGSLLPYVKDVSVVSKTFKLFAKTELGYRKWNGNDVSVVLIDIFQTSLLIVTRGLDGKGDFRELQAGIKQVNNFIFSENYQIEKAITDASKAAYLAKLIEHDQQKFSLYQGNEQMSDMLIEFPLNTKLNKLKKTNTEAFFYWYHIYLLEKANIQSV
jgi:hypothetical protein